MAYLKILSATLALASLGMPSLRAAEPPKPKVRAITGFITIDSKSYPSQIEETVRFLSQVRDAVKAAGYDVAGIRISTQPFPDYTRGLSRTDALLLLRNIDDLAGKLHFAPNIGPAMLKDTDSTGPVDLLAEVLSTPGNRLNANIVTAGEDGIHWNAIRQAARLIRTVGQRSPHGQGNFNFAAIAMLKPYGPFYPGAWHPGGGARSFAIGLESANVVMDVFSREHDPRTAGKKLTDALSVHARAVEAAATKAAAGTGWTYQGIDPTPAPGGDVSIGAAIESFTGAAFGSPGHRDCLRHHYARREGRARETDGLLGSDAAGSRRDRSHAPVDGGHLWPRFDTRLLRRLRGRRGYSAARGRYERRCHCAHCGRCRDAGLQVEQAPGRAAVARAGQEGRRNDRVQRRTVERDHSAAYRVPAAIAVGSPYLARKLRIATYARTRSSEVNPPCLPPAMVTSSFRACTACSASRSFSA